ncbi:pyridoxal phosphate-dependent aminotransferase, partial [Paenarthrobacter nicotinovorans]
WFGEPDEPTPREVREVAAASLDAGNTFYVQTLGMPSLRAAIAGYVSALHKPIGVDRIAVTNSGTTALMTAIQTVIGPGDRVVTLTPQWPNLVEMPKVVGATVETVPLDFSVEEGWHLDIDKLLKQLTPGTAALMLNSPNNPTGWTVSREQQQRILDRCRQHGIWIIADDVYERFYFEGNAAPSFLDIADEDDKVISANSFSKGWLMTGWRAGWLVAPKPLIPQIGKLIEFSAGCTPAFVQEAAQFALENGEATIARTLSRFKTARDYLHDKLATIPGVHLGTPAPGAMYTFFKVDGITDSFEFCTSLLEKTGLGLAPGTAFGPEGQGYLRWCFASDLDRIDDGVDRLRTYLMAR